jgi:hypothetical protein
MTTVNTASLADFEAYWASSGKADFWGRRPDGAQAHDHALDVLAHFAMGAAIAEVFTADEAGDNVFNDGPAAGGTTVYIGGSGFNGTTGVLFDATAATGVVVLNDHEIKCVTPAHAAGVVAVTVSNPKGDAVKAAAFTYA